MATKRLCAVDGCGKPCRINKYCGSHQRRWKTYGDPLKGRPGTRPGEPMRFLKEVAAPYQSDECLLWPYTKTNYGYGEILVDRRKRLAHRTICLMVHGPQPPDKGDVAHSCGNRLCVNPRHVRYANRTENEADKVTHGKANRGQRHGMAKLTEEQIRSILDLKGHMTQIEIGKVFGVHQDHVSLIMRRRIWKSVD